MNTTPHKVPLLLTFLTLASLTLAGCASSEAGETVPSDASASTSASAEATTDSSASTPGADSADSSAGEQKYSGGSKAPAGEYRAADEHGPAQNVPKPKEPEGMNIESTEGIEKFLNYWNDLNNYAVQTGDVSEVALLVDPSLESEIDYYSAIASTYAQGGWNVGGRQKLNFSPDLVISLGNGEYAVGITFEYEDMIGVLPEEVTSYKYSEDSLKGYEATLKFTEGKWILLDIQEAL